MRGDLLMTLKIFSSFFFQDTTCWCYCCDCVFVRSVTSCKYPTNCCSSSASAGRLSLLHIVIVTIKLQHSGCHNHVHSRNAESVSTLGNEDSLCAFCSFSHFKEIQACRPTPVQWVVLCRLPDHKSCVNVTLVCVKWPQSLNTSRAMHLMTVFSHISFFHKSFRYLFKVWFWQSHMLF